MADYGDILLNAVKTVVDGSIADLSFDKTEICTIVKNHNAEKGEYTVNDGSTTFLAYSDNTGYTVGQSVYVTIPKGDYSKQKLITGKYTANNGTYYTYTSPWKNYVDITGDLVADTSPSSILANGQVTGDTSDEQVEEILLGEYKLTDGNDYSAIGLKANFRAWLSGLGAEFGTYGLRLYIRTVNHTLGGTDTYKTKKAELSTLDMYGNPYMFESWYSQEKVFDVSGLGEIYSISLYLFQKNDFYTANNMLVANHTPDGKRLDDNIFVNDIYLSLGYSIEDFNGDMVKLYTQDSVEYSSEYGRFGEENEKNILVRWIHKKEDESIIAYTDMSALGETARIHWYKYRLDQNVHDDLAGAFWEEIEDWRDTFEQSINCFDYISEQEVKFKVIVETPVKEYILRDMPHDESVNKAQNDLMIAEGEYATAQQAYKYDKTDENLEKLNNAEEALKKATDTYNAVTEVYTADVNLFESDVLTFVNQQQVADLATLDLIQSLKLDIDPDGYKGIYTLYDQTNQIQNSTEATKLRKIVANYESTLTGDTDLDAAESITWMIPLVNTMIVKPENGKEFDALVDDVTTTEDGQFMIIKRDGAENNGSIGTVFNNASEQYFRIKNYFTESATNNVISCYVVKNQKTYTASADLSFGPMGTNGTDFTFILSMESDRTCVFKQDHDPLQVIASLYDYNNLEVPHAGSSRITYSWHSQDDITKLGFCSATGNLYDKINREIVDIKKTDTLGKVDVTYADGTVEKNTTISLLQNFMPQVDEYDTHLSCYIRRLTDYEIQAINGIATKDYTVEDSIPFFYILEASFKVNVNSEKKALDKKILNTYLAIPYSGDYDFTQISGTTKIVYNSSGTNPYYYKDVYKLYSYTDPVDGVTWDERNGAQTIGERKFYPKIDDNGAIIPSSNFVQQLSPQVAAVGFKDMDVLQTDANGRVSVVLDTEGNPVKESTIVWTQPILISQNAYSSAFLNAWNGSLTIDEDKGTIMSAMVGAGYKDEYNRYNGILMGDVESKADTGAGTGLFGYSEGVQSYGFKINGTAFIGKSGKGQIQFDGNSGIIQSMSYKNGQAGMKIDLDDGLIEMRGNEVTTVKIIKTVETIDVTDFTADLNDIYLLVDGESIEITPELNNAIQLLQQYNNVAIKDMSETEITLVEDALNLLRNSVTEVQFREMELQEYLADKVRDYEAEIADLEEYIAYTNECIDQIKTSSNADDQEMVKRLEDELNEKIAKQQDLEKAIQELHNYNAVCHDLKVFESALKVHDEIVTSAQTVKSLEEYIAEYTAAVNTYTAEQAILAAKQEAAQAAEMTAENTKNSEFSNIPTEDDDNYEYQYAVYQNALDEYEKIASEHADIVSMAQDVEAELAKLTQLKNDVVTQYNSATETLQQHQESYNAYLQQLTVAKGAAIQYTDIIDETAVIADLKACYKSLSPEEKDNLGTTTMDAFVAQNLDAAMQETYYTLLATEDASSILPTKLVNSTTETPMYETTRSKIRLATESPYFQIVDEQGESLVTIADKNYYLQSSGYTESTQIDGSGAKGVKFDLKKGKLTGYNFNLSSTLSLDDTEDDAIYNGSYISIGSAGTAREPFMRVHYTLWDSADVTKPLYDTNLLNITRSAFTLHSQNWKDRESGMELDLTRGTLKAFSGFNFKAYSNGNTGNYIQMSSDGNPFFRIHYMDTNTELDLMNVTKTAFIIQSQNWIAGQSGIQLNLTKGSIKAYDNFSLLAKMNTGSYIQLMTTDQKFAFAVHLTKEGIIVGNTDDTKRSNSQDVDLLKITESKFVLRSHNWKLKDANDVEYGMELDLVKGKITAHSFTIKAFRPGTNNQYIAIDSTAPTSGHPIDVKGQDGIFQVGWDGKVTANYLTATVGGQIGPFFFDEDAFWTGTKSASGSGIYIHESDGFGVSNGNFIVDKDGALAINSDQFTVSSTGETRIKASAYIDGDLYISGQIIGSNWGTSGAGTAEGYTSASYGGRSGTTLGVDNLKALGGEIGQWVIDTNGYLVGTGEAGSITLDPVTPEITLVGQKTLSMTTSQFQVGDKFLIDYTNDKSELYLGSGGKIAASSDSNTTLTFNKSSIILNGWISVGDAADKANFSIIRSGLSISGQRTMDGYSDICLSVTDGCRLAGNLYVKQGNKVGKGVTGTYELDNEGVFTGKSTLKFVNGVLVSFGEGADGDVDVSTKLDVDALKKSLGLKALAYCDYIKKKFSVTMSGSGNSGLYTQTSDYTTYYTGSNCNTVYIWQDSSGGLTCTESSTNPDSKTYTLATYYKPGHWSTGATNIYSYTAAGDSSITMTGTSGEVTLEPSDTDPDTISITIDNATVSF